MTFLFGGHAIPKQPPGDVAVAVQGCRLGQFVAGVNKIEPDGFARAIVPFLRVHRPLDPIREKVGAENLAEQGRTSPGIEHFEAGDGPRASAPGQAKSDASPGRLFRGRLHYWLRNSIHQVDRLAPLHSFSFVKFPAPKPLDPEGEADPR